MEQVNVVHNDETYNPTFTQETVINGNVGSNHLHIDKEEKPKVEKKKIANVKNHINYHNKQFNFLFF